MTTKDLDQFMVDFQTPGSVIEVDASWLQDQLRQLSHVNTNNELLLDTIEMLKQRIADKDTVIDVYKTLHARRVRLDISNTLNIKG